jgi:hypothetical protein
MKRFTSGKRGQLLCQSSLGITVSHHDVTADFTCMQLKSAPVPGQVLGQQQAHAINLPLGKISLRAWQKFP